MEIPKEINERIRELAGYYNIPYESLVSEYERIFNSEFVQTDPQFKTDDDRHAYSIRVLWVRVAAQPATKRFQVIPLGYTEERTTRAGVAMSTIYALVREENRLEPKLIICKGQQARLYETVELWNLYEIELGEGKDVLYATSKTVFENPKPISIDPLKLYTKYLGVEIIKVRDTVNKLTRVDESGFIDKMDLRMIRGIVVRYNKGVRPDGTKWGLYVISDDSVTQQEITEDGKIIPSQFTVWTPFSQVRYDVESEIIVVGTVHMGDEEPYMNAIAVIPVHAKPIEVL